MNPRSATRSLMFLNAPFLINLLAFDASLSCAPLRAQGGADLQARVGELKESMAKNKQALAQYTWEETVKIVLKGQERKVEHFQVREGADGKPVKTSLDSPAAQASGNQGGRLKQRIVAKKKEEYEEYADRMKELVQHYIPPDKDAIQDAYSKGNIAIIPGREYSRRNQAGHPQLLQTGRHGHLAD
jgi:hypothetical protein